MVLALALPGILGLGWIVARFVTRTRLLAALLAPGFAIALWMEAAHLVAYNARSFHVALWGVTAALGVGGYIALWRARPRLTDLSRAWRLGSYRAMVLSGLVTTLLIAPLAWRAAFHDEIGVHGHLSMASSIQNAYPPRDIGFPELELRYHYGYDLVCAMLASIFRTNVSVAGDIVTTGCWLYLWVLAWTVGRRLAGRWGGPVTALTLIYGAGVPFICPSQTRSSELGAQLLGFCKFGGLLRNSPIVSYHFQHPWTMGLPIALCILLVLDAAPHRPARWMALSWLLASLAICQVVLFASLAGAIPVADALRRRPDRWKSAALTTLSVVVAVGLASRGGGFFAPGKTGFELDLHAGVAETLGGSFEWLVRVYGLLLVLGVAGHFLARRSTAAYALLALGGLAVVDTIRYKHTWDIVKFATVATVGLAIPSGVVVARALASSKVALKALGAAALAALTFSGIGFHLALLLDLAGVPDMYRRTPPAMAADDTRAADWLRHNMPPTSVMYRNERRYIAYAAWAGLPQAYFDPRHMSAIEGGRDRTALLKSLPAESAAYLAEGIRFFVLEPGDTRVIENADRWIAAGEATERARFGKLRIVELAAR